MAGTLIRFDSFTMMAGFHVALIPLLAALSPLVSGQNLLGACTDWQVEASDKASYAIKSGNCCSRPLYPQDIFARQVVSRMGKQSGKTNLPCAYVLGVPTPFGLQSVRAFSPGAMPLVLATGWQFECHAAPHPRAPSHSS